MLSMTVLQTVVTEMLGVTINYNIVVGNYFLVLVVDEYHVHEGEKEHYLFHSPYIRGKNTLSNPKAKIGVQVDDAVLVEFLHVEYTRRDKYKR